MRRLVLLLAALASAAGAETLVVGNKGEDTVSLIDLETGRQRARIETGKWPHEVAISPDGKTAAVVSYGAASIDLIEIVGRRRSSTIDLGDNSKPHGLAWLSDGRIVATTEGSRAIVVVEPGARRVRAIATGQEGTHMLAISPDGARAYTANMGAGSVSVIDLRAMRKLRDIAIGGQPEGIALTPDGRQLWIADRQRDSITVFDSANFRRLAAIPVGKTPIRIAISPDGRRAVTSNYGGGDLSVIDVPKRTLARTIKVSGAPDFQQVTILFSRDGKRLYVAETGASLVAELEWPSGRLLGRLGVGRGGDGLGIAAANVALP